MSESEIDKVSGGFNGWGAAGGAALGGLGGWQGSRGQSAGVRAMETGIGAVGGGMAGGGT